jgi:hypothetical protein
MMNLKTGILKMSSWLRRGLFAFAFFLVSCSPISFDKKPEFRDFHLTGRCISGRDSLGISNIGIVITEDSPHLFHDYDILYSGQTDSSGNFSAAFRIRSDCTHKITFSQVGWIWHEEALDLENAGDAASFVWVLWPDTLSQ